MKRQFQLKSLKIKNYRSFYSEQTIVFGTKTKINSVTALYGPNASGKSNTAIALLYIYQFLLKSSDANILHLPYDPFLLKEGSGVEDSEFELVLTSNSRNLRYTFAVNRERVSHESLVELSSNFNKPEQIFGRNFNKKTDNYDYSSATAKHGFGKKIIEATRSGALLITIAREFNNEYANLIFDWLAHTNILIGESPQLRNMGVRAMSNNPSLKDGVLKLLKDTDFWIRDMPIQDVPIPDALVDSLPLAESEKLKIRGQMGASVKTSHAVRNKNGDIVGDVLFDMVTQESAGTNGFFDIAAPIIDTINKGMILYIDEFGAHIHPDISQYIVRMFADSTINHAGAQLIINAHDTSLMAPDSALGRDNIILVEKNMFEESVVKPLAKKSVRKDEQYEKRYRQGLYGAKPYLDIEDD